MKAGDEDDNNQVSSVFPSSVSPIPYDPQVSHLDDVQDLHPPRHPKSITKPKSVIINETSSDTDSLPPLSEAQDDSDDSDDDQPPPLMARMPGGDSDSESSDDSDDDFQPSPRQRDIHSLAKSFAKSPAYASAPGGDDGDSSSSSDSTSSSSNHSSRYRTPRSSEK